MAEEAASGEGPGMGDIANESCWRIKQLGFYFYVFLDEKYCIGSGVTEDSALVQARRLTASSG